jgi:hypothetical protein
MRILAALGLLVSVNAFACPDLTGSYTCKYQDGTSETMTFSQQDNKDGVTVYNMNGENLPADNQVYNMQDSQNLKNGTFRLWCDQANSAILDAEVLGQYYDQGQYYGDLTLDMAYSLDNGNLKQVTTGSLKGAAGQQPINDEMTCTRN